MVCKKQNVFKQMLWPLCLKQVQDLFRSFGEWCFACAISSLCVSASSWPITIKSSSLPALILYPLVVIDREERAARCAVEVLALTTLLAKPCDTSFCAVTDIDDNIIVKGEISKCIIQDVFLWLEEGEVKIINRIIRTWMWKYNVYVQYLCCYNIIILILLSILTIWVKII